MSFRASFVRHSISVAVGLALLLGASAGVAAPEKKKENPHLKKGGAKACLVCHVVQPGTKGATGRKDGNIQANGDIVAVCSGCHSQYSHMHPVKIVISPDMKSPEDLPLDKEGKITCVTCHDVMEGHGIKRKKVMKGRALCLNCHFDSDILAQIVWYPTHLKPGEQGKLEIKASEFRVLGRKASLGDSVLLYYTYRNVDTKHIEFGTNILYDDGSHGDRVAHDGIYTLTEAAGANSKKERRVYTGWILDGNGRRSNTVTLAIEYE